MKNKNKKCRAFAVSTQKQCANKPLPGSKYCWRHQDARTVITAIVIGIVTGLVLPKAWDYIFPSEKIEQMAADIEIIKEVVVTSTAVSSTTTIDSSSIDVYLKFSVDKDTQGKSNATSNEIHFCFLTAKTGAILVYKTRPFESRRIRGERQYEYIFNAELPSHENIYSEKPEEFYDATKITVPIGRFVKRIGNDLKTEFECKLEHVKIKFYVNGKIVDTKERTFEKDNIIDESMRLNISLRRKPHNS